VRTDERDMTRRGYESTAELAWASDDAVELAGKLDHDRSHRVGAVPTCTVVGEDREPRR
jgi:hypothetical protein